MAIAALIPAAPLTLSLAPPIPTRCQERWGDAARKLADILNDDMFRSLEGKSKHQLWLELCDMITKHPKVRGYCCRACSQASTRPQRARLAASVQGRGSLVVQMKGPGDVVRHLGCVKGCFSLLSALRSLPRAHSWSIETWMAVCLQPASASLNVLEKLHVY